jgi:hypothetical protein
VASASAASTIWTSFWSLAGREVQRIYIRIVSIRRSCLYSLLKDSRDSCDLKGLSSTRAGSARSSKRLYSLLKNSGIALLYRSCHSDAERGGEICDTEELWYTTCLDNRRSCERTRWRRNDKTRVFGFLPVAAAARQFANNVPDKGLGIPEEH